MEYRSASKLILFSRAISLARLSPVLISFAA